MIFLSSADFFEINFLEKFYQEYCQGVKQFGSRSGLTKYLLPDLDPNCLTLLQLFAKLISRRQNSPLARKVKYTHYCAFSKFTLTYAGTLTLLPCFIVVCWFFQNQLLGKSLSRIPSVSNNLDPDQTRQNVGPDLGPNCSLRLSADVTRR